MNNTQVKLKDLPIRVQSPVHYQGASSDAPIFMCPEQVSACSVLLHFINYLILLIALCKK